MGYKFEFTPQEVQTILAGIGELQFKTAWQLFNKIQLGAAEQDRASAVPLSDLGFTEVRSESSDKASQA